MQPRMLVTFDEELRPLPVAVRVGQVGNLNTDVFSRYSFFQHSLVVMQFWQEKII